jgi:ERCC4-related helicase
VIEELIDGGHQVAVSVQYLESLETIRGALASRGVRCATIHGAMGPTEREAERLAFQRGERPVVLFTVVEGISLHQGQRSHGGNDVPRALLVHDVRPSAIQTTQIEGRCHRDGQNANVYYLYAEETVEAKVVRTVIERVRDMKVMLADVEDELDRELLDLLLAD